MKRQLVESNAKRVAAIESGGQKVAGVNIFTESVPSALMHAADGGFSPPTPMRSAFKLSESELGVRTGMERRRRRPLKN